ncbi:hypothetical protein HELRODRAFT_159446 [Helobdella robusta]|uniref:Peptidase C2 calpain large subunit domain-containing protein n=1 Tax=Helobdella robusta TaxID=6412 RepID=T1EP17_HELRO|nr:hypothetical protein HELRODRAFT_159446 [Helobdella robusta]ESO12859.1 hypothetical protein HELRODRAFT_159446 [Helobdella robusta]
MSFEDFVANFSGIAYCNWKGGKVCGRKKHEHWKTTVSDVNPGCCNCSGTNWVRNIEDDPNFWRNQQYLIGVSEEESKASPVFVISLNQIFLEGPVAEEKISTVDFHIYKLKDDKVQENLTSLNWKSRAEKIDAWNDSDKGTTDRQLTRHVRLDSGNYVLIPCTDELESNALYALTYETVQTIQNFYSQINASAGGREAHDHLNQTINNLNNLKSKFERFAEDTTATVHVRYLQNLFLAVHPRMDQSIMNSIIFRYGGSDVHMSFDDFVQAMYKTVYRVT